MENETPGQRIAKLDIGTPLLDRCSTFYSDVTNFFKEYPELLRKFIAGKRILEIGYGEQGGLARFVMELGALSYKGVDISSKAHQMSIRQNLDSRVEFIWDDPVYIIQRLAEPHVIISTGFFDKCIIKDEKYAREVIQAISQRTPIGEHTIHGAANFQANFGRLFVANSFEKVEIEERPLFTAYRRNMNLEEYIAALERCKDPEELSGRLKVDDNFRILLKVDYETLIRVMVASDGSGLTFSGQYNLHNSEELKLGKGACIYYKTGTVTIQICNFINPYFHASYNTIHHERQIREFNIGIHLNPLQPNQIPGISYVEALALVVKDILQYCRKNQIPVCLPKMDPPIYFQPIKS